MSGQNVNSVRDFDGALSFVDCEKSAPLGAFESRVAAMIGCERVVMTMGGVPASVVALLEQQGCRLMASTGATNDARERGYDAILALDLFSEEGTLESALSRARSQLREGGFLVASFQNAVHGQRRISMLLGAEPEHSCPKPLSLATASVLLGKVQFAIGKVERETARVVVPEGADRSLVTEDLMERLNADLDATATRYLIAAYPTPWPGLNWLHIRLLELSDQVAKAERNEREAGEDLEILQGHLSELIRLQEESRGVVRELRERLIATHGLLASRDSELRELHARLTRASQEIAGIRASIPGRACQWVDAVRKRIRRLVGI